MINILAAGYGTVSDIEVIWVLIALFGMLFSVYNVKDAIDDIRAIRGLNLSNGRLIIARASLKSEIARFVILFIFFMIGVMAMILPEVPAQLHQPFVNVAIGAAIRWGLIISGVLITLKSYWAFQVRRELVASATEEQKTKRDFLHE